jgi:hypothetical protein
VVFGGASSRRVVQSKSTLTGATAPMLEDGDDTQCDVSFNLGGHNETRLG